MTSYTFAIGNTLESLDLTNCEIRELEEYFNLPPEICYRIDLALEEMVSNVIKYAYADSAFHEILLHIQFSDDCVELELVDDGVAFDPLAFTPEDPETAPEDRRIGGLGIVLVRSFAEEVQYTRINDENHLYIKFGINQGE